jgi:hypothetical protein
MAIRVSKPAKKTAKKRSKRKLNPALAELNKQRAEKSKKVDAIDNAELDKQLAQKEAQAQIARNATRVQDLCEEQGYDPMKSLLDLAVGGELSPSEQMRLDFKLMDKMYGDVKSVEGGDDGSMQYNVTMKSMKELQIADLKSNLVPKSEYEGFEAEDIKVESGASDGLI